MDIGAEVVVLVLLGTAVKATDKQKQTKLVENYSAFTTIKYYHDYGNIEITNGKVLLGYQRQY